MASAGKSGSRKLGILEVMSTKGHFHVNVLFNDLMIVEIWDARNEVWMPRTGGGNRENGSDCRLTNTGSLLILVTKLSIRPFPTPKLANFRSFEAVIENN